MYIYDARIRYSEAGCENRLTPEGLLNYFQDCSTFHSEDLGFGVKYMLAHRLVWALGSWQIDIARYPEIGERVRVGTLPYDFKGYIGFRNFWMTDERGERLAAANSIWTLLDLETGKPVKPAKEMLDAYRTSPKIEMEYLPRKILIPEEKGTGAAPGRNVLGEEAEDARSGGAVRLEKQTYTVTRRYLDANRHVNNGQYVRMALEYVEDGFAVKRLRAEYKRQAYLGDVFCPVVYREENRYTVSLNNEAGEPYAVVEFTGERIGQTALM